MSDYEQHRGRIQKLNISPAKFMESKLNNGIDYITFADLKEAFLDEFYDEFIFIDNSIWHIYDSEKYDPRDSFCDLERLESGVDNFTFNTRFYNGGAGLEEMLENAILKL